MQGGPFLVNPFYKNLALWLVISLVMILIFNLFNQSRVHDREISYTEFMAQVEKGIEILGRSKINE